MAVPFVDAEVFVEGVGDGVPGHRPFHAGFQALDVGLRRARGVGESGIAGVEMGKVGYLVSSEGAAAAGMVGPAEDAGFEEGAVDDQLTAAFEEVEQAGFAVGSIELVLLLHGQPWHAPALGGQRVALPREPFLVGQQTLASLKPFLWRHYFCVLNHAR
jgi:hypothetical protein